MARKTESRQLAWERLESAREDGGMFKLDWEVHRAKVPGGWLVLVLHNTQGLTFYPDPDHEWDGASSR